MFGRRKQDDEDPFAALKQDGTYQSNPTVTLPGVPGSEPTVTALPGIPGSVPTGAPPPPVQPARTRPPPSHGSAQRRPRPRRPGVGGPVLLRALIPFVAVVVVAVIVTSSTTSSSPTFTSIVAGPSKGSNPGTPAAGSGSRHSSYLTASGLAAGLAHVRRVAPGSKLLLLRIDPTSLDATVKSRPGQAEVILISPSGTLKESAGSPGSLVMPFSQIRPDVPPRLIEELGAKFHVPKSRISYMLAFSFPGLSPSWGIYLKNDTNYQASLSGAGLHKNG